MALKGCDCTCCDEELPLVALFCARCTRLGCQDTSINDRTRPDYADVPVAIVDSRAQSTRGRPKGESAEG